MTTCVRPEDASRHIADRIRTRWSGVSLRVRTRPGEVVVHAPYLTGRTGRAAVVRAVAAVLGGTWTAVATDDTITVTRDDTDRD